MPKLTDLTKIMTAAPAVDDWVHIVDKSDTSEDPAGSSYKITQGNFLQDYLNKDGSVALTGDWDAGTYKITCGSFVVKHSTDSDITITPSASLIQLEVGASITEVSFNSNTNDVDRSFWGTSAGAPVLFIDAGTNRVGINTGSPDPLFDLDISGALKVGGDLNSSSTRLSKGWFADLDTSDLTVDNVDINGNTITATTGDLNLASTSGNVKVSAAFGLATGTTVNEISTTVSASSTDNQLITGEASYEVSVPGMKVTVPATKTSTGAIGNWAFDETTGYHYLCYDTNKWARSIYATDW